MRVAVISDIHANDHALTAVLEEVDAAAPDELWCLGDVVGYGPAPNECCATLSKRADVCLVGNHDLVVVERLSIDEFNHDARTAALWTQGELKPEWHAWLTSLQPEARRDGVGLFHASARDPVWEYVLSSYAAAASFEAMDAPLILVGHSHIALAIDDRFDGGQAPDKTEIDLSTGRWLLNPGSVGQPRDGDPRAAWLLLDTDRKFAEFHRVAYPIEQTQSAMRSAGLPEALAARIAHGI
jgi:diadenosine tetraphosphatase ApaH/serine/threonine PP2A family protein phosphatase